MYFSVEHCDSADICTRLAFEMSKSADLNWIALVDGAFDLDTRNVPAWSRREMLFAYAGFDDVVHASPYLVPLMVADAACLLKQLRILVDHRKNRPMLSFISSKYSAVDICLRWKNFVNVSVPDDQEFILRFADTRITEILPTCLSQDVWAGLSNMLEAWWFIDRQGIVSPLPVSGTTYVDKGKTILAAKEFAALVDRCEPDAIIDVLHRKQPELLDQRSPYPLYQRMKIVSEFARSNKVHKFPDVVALATFDLVSVISIEKNLKLHSLIKERKWSSGNLIDLLLEIAE